MSKENRPVLKNCSKILVVDDEPDITASFQSFLEKRGFLVKAAANGIDALGLIKTFQPHLVFLDLTLGEGEWTGKDVLRKLRIFDKQTKVIIITGQALVSEDEDREFKLWGISAYLIKPVVLETLVGMIESILENKSLAMDFRGHITHRLRNLLGVMRNQCEVFLLNKRDGLFPDKSEKELEKMSDEIIGDVIKTVDQVIGVLESIQEEK